MRPTTTLTCTAVRLTATAIQIDIAGDLVFPRAGVLHTAATAALAEAGLHTLVLDFTKLTFLDSSGLSALLRIRRVAAGAGLDLQLQHRTDQLDIMLHRTGLHDYLTGEQRPDRASGTSTTPVPDSDW